jgi:hypothetical protein
MALLQPKTKITHDEAVTTVAKAMAKSLHRTEGEPDESAVHSHREGATLFLGAMAAYEDLKAHPEHAKPEHEAEHTKAKHDTDDAPHKKS